MFWYWNSRTFKDPQILISRTNSRQTFTAWAVEQFSVGCDAEADSFTADVELFSTRLLDCVLGTGGVLFVGTSNSLK